MSRIRLQVALAKANLASRRKAAELVKSGRVRVNGRIASEPGFRVDPAKDRVTLDGRPIFFAGKKYYILNKPAGVLSTAKDERGRKTVLDCLKIENTRLYPVGRLDKDTTGLVMLTNDGELTYRLTHPKFGISRTYEAVAKGAVTAAEAERLKRGVRIDGKPARAERIVFKRKARDFTILLITLSEGRKREIRRMLEIIGHEAMALKRISYGPIAVKGLAKGEYRALTDDEVEKLKGCVGLK